MARTADAAVMTKWRERLDRWRRSKLSIAAFCRQEQISQPSFFQWRRRLQQPADDTSRFVQLPSPAWPAAGGVQVTLPSGAVVTLPGQASAELIAAVVQAAMLAPQEDERC